MLPDLEEKKKKNQTKRQNKQTKNTKKRGEKKKENWKIIPYGYKVFYPRKSCSIVPKAVLSLQVRNVRVKAG